MDVAESLLLFAIIAYASVASLALVFEILHKRADLLDPGVQFILIYSLFVLPLPVRAYLTDEVVGGVTPHLPYLKPHLAAAVLLCAFGLLFFLPAYHSRLACRIAYALPLPGRGSVQGSRVAFFVLSLVSILLLLLLGREFGGISSLILRGYASNWELFGRGYLALGFSWSFVAVFFLLHSYAVDSRRRTDLVFFILLFAVLMLVQLIMGNRNLAVYMLLTLLVFVHNAIRRLHGRLLIVIGMAVFLAANVHGFVRGSRYGSVGDYFRSTADQVQDLKEAGQLVRAAAYTLTIGEFVVPFETLPQIMASLGSEVSPLFGLSYMRAPLFFIPSALLPDRPPYLSSWYVEQFYGAGEDPGKGRAFFFLAEGYINFGPAGALLVLVLWGVGLGVLKELRSSGRTTLGRTLLYALSLAFIYRGVRGDFVSLLVTLTSQGLVPAILGLTVASGFRPWYRIRGT